MGLLSITEYTHSQRTWSTHLPVQSTLVLFRCTRSIRICQLDRVAQA